MYLELGTGKTRYSQAKLRNAAIKQESRQVARALQFRGERLRVKAKPRRPKRKGHHGWRFKSIH